MPAFTRLAAPADWDAVVARDGDRVITERDFRARVRGWLDVLSPLQQHAVAIHEPDGAEFAAMLLGAWFAGKVTYLPGDAQPATCRSLKSLGAALVGDFAAEWESVRAAPPGNPALAFEAMPADRIHVVIHTSGTSGEPKALSKRLPQLFGEVETLERAFGERVGSAEVVSTVSHQHIYGLLFKILWPIIRRRPFASRSVMYPEGIIAAMRARPTVLVSGPAHLKRLPASLDWSAARAGARLVFSSGGPLSLEAVGSVEQILGTTPVEVYGSSETGGIAWRQRHDGKDEPWTPMPGVDVRATDGVLEVRSPHLPDAGWHTAADHIRFVDDRRFLLEGRSDRIAKVEGKRISLAAVEDAMVASGLAAEARVIPLPDGDRDALAAVVVPSPKGWERFGAEGIRALRTALVNAVTDRTERIGAPRRWRWLDQMPVNETGKTSQAGLAALFEPGALSIPAVHIAKVSGGHAELLLYVSPKLICFDGHFADLPVLPGVAQVDWAVMLAHRAFDGIGTFQRMEAVKFFRLYQPDAPLRAALDWHPDRGLLTFGFESPAGKHSSGRIFFSK